MKRALCLPKIVRVLYDVTVLGHAQRDPWQRTGVFRVVDEVARRLAKEEKCDLTFCCAVNPGAKDDALAYIEEDPELNQVPFLRSGLRALGRAGSLQLDRSIDTAQGVAKLGLRAARRLVRTFEGGGCSLTRRQQQKSDVFHAPAFYLPDELAEQRRLKCFLTIYDLIPVFYPEWCRDGSRDFVERGLAGLSKDRWAICISESTKRDLCNHLPSFDPSHAVVIPLAASDSFYPCVDLKARARVRARYGIPDLPYLLSLSTLEPRKNIAHLIRCFSALVRETGIDDLNLVLVGAKGWSYESIFDALAEEKIPTGRVILPGYVSDEDLAPLYSGALAFVYPSLYEGFGLPPLEAMKSGTPVIASDNSSLPEVMGDAGIMAPADDRDALCQAMLELYRKPALAAELSRKGIERAKEFSWKKCADETLAAYETALEQ